MKVVILAGGLGSRLSEETVLRHKPMVEIGGKPILWHIMKIYSHYGYNDFIILCGYKSYMIKEYFSNYYRHSADMSINLKDNSIEYHNVSAEPWKITLLETGDTTMTGGRLKRAQSYIGKESFLLTYGDGLADININDLVSFHNSHGKAITMTTVQPEGRFGAVIVNNSYNVTNFKEKPKGDNTWINGGFFVCQPAIFDYLEDDSTIFERQPLEGLARDGQLFAYQHNGFWKAMDMLRDKQELENLIETKNAYWKVWEK